MANDFTVKRYCIDCKKFVGVSDDDRRENELCAICKSYNTRLTLRQRKNLLYQFKEGDSAQVRKIMSLRAGQTGTIVDSWLYGLHLDFFGPAPSIEAWDWDELEVVHLIPKNEEINKVTPPV